MHLFTVKNHCVTKEFTALLQQLDDAEYEVKKYFMKRTLPQNRTYRAYLEDISQEINDWTTPEELHAIFWQRFLLVQKWDFSYVRSTKDLTTKEMSVYLEQIRILVAEYYWITIRLRCEPPLPNEPY